MFGTNQPRGKKRFCTPSPQTVKKTDFNVYVLPEPTQLSPKGSKELELAHAGLGKRMITMAENLKHDEVIILCCLQHCRTLDVGQYQTKYHVKVLTKHCDIYIATILWV